MKFTFQQFMERYPDSAACLAAIWNQRYEGYICEACGQYDSYHKIPNRPAYGCSCGKQIYPLVGTIFQNTRIELHTWFYVMWVMMNTRSGVSAKFVERMTGLNYRTCWRMMRQIRSIMDDATVLEGDVEVDETFFAPKPLRDTRIGKPRRDVVVGLAERSSGRVIVQHVDRINTATAKALTNKYVRKGSTIHTDGAPLYKKALDGYEHSAVVHWSIAPTSKDMRYFIPSADSGTQQIENFWSVLKRGIKGVYIHVSPKYMQLYAQEYAWRYSNRRGEVPMFEVLFARVSR